MATETKTVESNVAQVYIDLDSLLEGAACADSVTVPEESKPKSVFSNPKDQKFHHLFGACFNYGRQRHTPQYYL